MISKELLSKVLGEKVEEIGRVIDTTILAFRYSTHWSGMNIYELAHKCKEWFPKEAILLCWKNKFGWYIRIDTYESETIYEDGYFHTEPEAIFKACEWIRTNNDTK